MTHQVTARRLFPALSLLVLCVTAIGGSQQRTGAVDQTPGQPTFRSSTDLTVIDAVVVDDRGRHVRDLTAADFEVVQNGEPQRVRHAVYVSVGAAPSSTATPARGDQASALLPSPPAQPSTAPGRNSISDAPNTRNSRIIVVVVDDLGLSFESTAVTRLALTTFVNEHVGPGDLVAILRTGAGAGALQQFTSDKRLLHAAIDRLRWTVLSRSGVSAFTPVSAPDALGHPAAAGSGTAEADNEDTIEGLRTAMSTAASFGAVEFIVRGVEHLPGRKAVLFISEGMRLMARPKGLSTAGAGRAWKAFTRLMDRTNRAGVVVYTLDPRGLVSGLLTAEDNPQPRPPLPGATPSLSADAQNAVTEAAGTRRAFLLDSQEGLTYMAEQTGGFAILNTNDLSGGMRRVLTDLDGYYLIGYERPREALRSWDPGQVRIRVKRPGVRVRSRKGLFGPSDPDRPRDTPSGDPLVLAAFSPFGSGTLDVRLTALFGHDTGQGSFVRSFFFIDPAGVDFTRGDDGKYAAQLTLALFTIGEEGQITTQWRRLVDLKLGADTYRLARDQGILYSARIPIKAPGGYQLRAAARDERTSAVGSSSQFFEIPRVGKGRIALSSIVMRSSDAPPDRIETHPVEGVPETLAETVFGEPWIRIFGRGSDAIYTYEIYDGVSDSASTLTAVATLMHDGQPVYEGPVSPIRSKEAGEAMRVVPVAGRLSFGAATPAGFYTLRVTVSHTRAAKVLRREHQWASFEVR